MHEHGHEHGHHATTEHQGYEVSDVQVKIILIAGLAVVIMTAIAYIASTFTVRYLRAQPAIGDYRATPVAIEQQGKPWDLQTRLQVDPPRAEDEFAAAQAEKAGSFGVVSEEPQIYRIPVETAMKIVVEKGLPKFPKLAAPESGQESQ